MSLIMPNGSRTIPLPMPNKAPTGGLAFPSAPTTLAQPDQMQQMLDYLFQQLKAQYPGIPEADLRMAAQKLLQEARTKQAEEFNQRFFPERVQQAQPAPQPRPGMVAQNEQRPWKYSPGSPGGIQYTDTPDYQTQQQMAKRKQIAEEQANFAKTQAQNQAARQMAMGGNRQPVPSMPGQAQPIQEPSQGTPYQPQAGGWSAADQGALLAPEKPTPDGTVLRRYYRKPDGSIGVTP